MATITEPARPRSSDTAFIGHPAGLGWLGFTEFWERFSYYGMQALLVLYMTHYLLHPGHIEKVWFFGPFKVGLQVLYGGGLTQQAVASAVFGLYTALVYLTPIGGGLLADRLLGRTPTIAIGASLMALGHFLMAFEQSFLIALLCLMLGTGCFKGNISSQVGELYKQDDPRRADAFQIFLLSVQLAVILSPLVCGTLGEVYGWHWGFGAAGVGMLIGLAIYLTGRPTLPKDPLRNAGASEPRPPLTREGWLRIGALIGLLPVLAVAMVYNQQGFNAYLVWAEQNYQLVFFGRTMPVTWLLTLSSIISTTMLIAVVAFWRWYAKRWREPDEITKMMIGVLFCAFAPLVLVAGSALVALSHQKLGLGWAIAQEIVNDIGFSNVTPVGLALYSRAAPKGFVGVVVGIYYLQYFLGNLFVGYVGGLYDKMSATNFWLLHAALIFGAAAVLIVVRFFVGKILAPEYAEPEPDAVKAAV